MTASLKTDCESVGHARCAVVIRARPTSARLAGHRLVTARLGTVEPQTTTRMRDRFAAVVLSCSVCRNTRSQRACAQRAACAAAAAGYNERRLVEQQAGRLTLWAEEQHEPPTPRRTCSGRSTWATECLFGCCSSRTGPQQRSTLRARAGASVGSTASSSSCRPRSTASSRSAASRKRHRLPGGERREPAAGRPPARMVANLGAHEQRQALGSRALARELPAGSRSMSTMSTVAGRGGASACLARARGATVGRVASRTIWAARPEKARGARPRLARQATTTPPRARPGTASQQQTFLI
jgi:hypothetical protein